MMRVNHGCGIYLYKPPSEGMRPYEVFSTYIYSLRNATCVFQLFFRCFPFPMVLLYARNPKMFKNVQVVEGMRILAPVFVVKKYGETLYCSPTMASSFSFSLLARALKSRFSILTPVRSSEQPGQTRMPQLRQTRRDSLLPS